MNTLELFVAIASLATAGSAQVFLNTIPANADFGGPLGITRNNGNSLVYTDVQIPGSGRQLVVVDASGTRTFSASIATETSLPRGIALEPFGSGTQEVYVVDAGSLEIDVYGIVSGSPTYSFSFPVAGQTMNPTGIAVSSVTGNLFLLDTDGIRVLEYTPLGTFLTSFPLNDVDPSGIEHDSDDNTFWVYDRGTDSIRKYDQNFVELQSAPGPEFYGSNGSGIAVLGDNLYVGSSSQDEISVFAKNAVFADAESFDGGCPNSADFYELFAAGSAADLDGQSFTITPVGDGYTVTPTGSYNPMFSNPLSLGDDEIRRSIFLGFNADFPGFGSTSFIDIDSNGRIGPDLSRSEPAENVSTFLSEPMLAVAWDDLDATPVGRDVYFNRFVGFSQVTWSRVPERGEALGRTFQVKFHTDGRIECSYLLMPDDCLVGLSFGTNGVDPGSIDLSASLPIDRSGPGTIPSLSAMSRPIRGQSFDLQTSRIPATAVSGGILVGLSEIGLPISDGPVTCPLLSSGDLTTLPLMLGSDSTVTSLLLPSAPSLSGLSLTAQSLVIDAAQTAAIPALLSNGLRITIGDG